ncbi:hypothetical protein NDU88_007718 [Pleurodeles waltl]|uniref:Uncharacterized protein n=1 Tax=Pleurodeles waltl TaxID=8319 RepID=A0AAV7VTG9_PLEWA|nr:hypothetical protein NDU88_007718 [Pleurodeles waltl]
MGKSVKNQPKLHFDQSRANKLQEEQMDTPGPSEGSPNTEAEPELKQMLAAMQKSLATIDGKIDLLSFRMDRMIEMFNKHAELFDMVEKRKPDMEDDHTTLTSNQSTMDKTLAALQTNGTICA